MKAMVDIERLREAMRRRGFSQSTLAQQVGVSPAAIQQILNGSTKRSRVLPEIAYSLGVTLSWLTGEGDGSLDPTAEIKSPHDDRLDRAWLAKGSTTLPYLRLEDGDNIEPVGFLKAFICSTIWLNDIISKAGTDHLMVFRATSDSMMPFIRAGDDVMIAHTDGIDREHPDIVWAISFRGAKLFRRIRNVNSTTVRIAADDPVIPPFDAPAAEVQVTGRVVWIGRAYIP